MDKNKSHTTLEIYCSRCFIISKRIHTSQAAGRAPAQIHQIHRQIFKLKSRTSHCTPTSSVGVSIRAHLTLAHTSCSILRYLLFLAVAYVTSTNAPLVIALLRPIVLVEGLLIIGAKARRKAEGFFDAFPECWSVFLDDDMDAASRGNGSETEHSGKQDFVGDHVWKVLWCDVLETLRNARGLHTYLCFC